MGGVFFLILSSLQNAHAAQSLLARQVDKAPEIDGIENDDAWGWAKSITTHDTVADIDITLKAVYTYESISVLVIYTPFIYLYLSCAFLC